MSDQPDLMAALERSLSSPPSRLCGSCGTLVRPGDGGIRVQGVVYCSEECADEADAMEHDA
jgi:hypothetical protein